MRKISNKTLYVLIFFAALITRLIGVYLGGFRGDDSDGTYLQMARNFIDGQGFSLIEHDFGRLYSWLPPGMSFVYLPFAYLFTNVFLPMRVFTVLLAALAYVFYFRLVEKIATREHALIAVVILMLYPAQLLWSTRINPHTYAMHAVIFMLFFLFRNWEDFRWWRALLIGAVWAFVGLMRGEYMLSIGIAMLITFFAVRSRSAGVKHVFFMALGAFMVVAPWVARNAMIQHRFVLISTNFSDAIWEAYNPEYKFTGDMLSHPPELVERMKAIPNEVDRAHLLIDETKAYIKANPGRALYILGGNALNFWRPWLSVDKASFFENAIYIATYVPLFILFVIGLFMVPYRDPRWQLIVALIFFKFLIQLPFYVIVLYREGVMPLMIIISALPLWKLCQKRHNIEGTWPNP
jgi:hypothetical protein